MIVRPFLFDIKRTLTSKSVLIIIGLILLISLAIIPSSLPRIVSFPSSDIPSILYYYDAGGFHFLVFTNDIYGNPVSKSGIELNLFSASNNFNHTVQVSTNSSGIGVSTISAPAIYQPESYDLTIETFPSFPSGEGGSTIRVPISSLPSGTIQSLPGGEFRTVTDRYNASRHNLQVIYSGPYGAPPTGYSIYYKPITPPFVIKGSYNESEMTLFQNLTSIRNVYELPFADGLNRGTLVIFSIFKSGNTTAFETSELSVEEFRPQLLVQSATIVGSSFFAGILSFFVPLVAIIGSYSSYGKDRITGVLESVLARPVTRRGLAISRFVSTLLAICIPTIASAIIVDLILNSVTGSLLSNDYLLAIMSGLVVEIFAFVGLVFLLSHLLRSTGSLLGVSIGLFIVLDFFWNLIIFLAGALFGGTQGSALYLQATIISYYANPAQFLNLVNSYVFQNANGLPIQTSNYGLTLSGLVFDGVAWAVVPFLAFLTLAVKRD